MTPWVKRADIYFATGQNCVYRIMKQRSWPQYTLSWRPDDDEDSDWTRLGPRQATVREAKAYAVWVETHPVQQETQ